MSAQNRQMSLIEAIASTAAGFILTLLIQAVAYPLFGLHMSWATNLADEAERTSREAAEAMGHLPIKRQT